MEFERGIRDVSGVVFWGQLEQCVHSLGLPFKQEIPLLWSLKTKDLDVDSRRSLKNKDLAVKYF